MAERRMFAKTIIDSDAFLDMPLSSQALYFHLAMRADDDGFLNNAKKIMREIGSNQNDYDLLIAKRFIIQFSDGICVIKHWRIHNYIQSDRYKPTIYQEEKSMLGVKQNKAYTLSQTQENIPMDTNCIHDVYSLEAQVRLGKDRLGKDSKYSSHFVPPTLDEVKAYCLERKNNVDPEKWLDFYSSKGWMIGKNKMKDWKAGVRTWEKKSKPVQQKKSTNKFNAFPQRDYSNEEISEMERRLANVDYFEEG